jgi:hypothetical protein
MNFRSNRRNALSKRARYWTVITVFSAGVLLNATGCQLGQPKQMDDARRRQIVEALKQLPVEGPNIGPVTGIDSNKTTDAVVQAGQSIVPTLVAALDRSSWRQSVWIVFCLQELHASSARLRLIKLKTEVEQGRFKNEPHDFTLQVLIDTFLRTVN